MQPIETQSSSLTSSVPLLTDIERMVEIALRNGCLTPGIEAEMGRICDTGPDLSVNEYMALDRLMSALLTGEVVALHRRQSINVMEELGLKEAIARSHEHQVASNTFLDVGEITAYALNRLPPLYATTEEGAVYQRQRAQESLQSLIVEQVQTAIDHNLSQPIFFPDRRAIGTVSSRDICQQVTTLLQTIAPNFESSH